MKSKLRKRLSAPGLLEAVRLRFGRISDPLAGKTAFPLVNCFWITDFHITEGDVYALMKGARARWKIENETFNTLKTQGYHFEHNYGHGYKNLSTVMSYLMMLAFLIDQIQQLCCPQFQAALKKCKKRYRLWEYMRSWFTTFLIDSWEAFFTAIVSPPDFRLSLEPG